MKQPKEKIKKYEPRKEKIKRIQHQIITMNRVIVMM